MGKEDRIDLHDLKCAEAFDQLQQLGCFDEEFASYGTAYWEKGQVHYFVSSNADKVYEFVANCSARQLYPIPVVKHFKRQQILSGEQEQSRQESKIALAKQIKTRYPAGVLQKLWFLGQQPSNNQALELLSALQDQLTDAFDEDALQLFEGLLQMAFQAKLLDQGNYYHKMH